MQMPKSVKSFLANLKRIDIISNKDIDKNFIKIILNLIFGGY